MSRIEAKRRVEEFYEDLLAAEKERKEAGDNANFHYICKLTAEVAAKAIEDAVIKGGTLPQVNFSLEDWMPPRWLLLDPAKPCYCGARFPCVETGSMFLRARRHLLNEPSAFCLRCFRNLQFDFDEYNEAGDKAWCEKCGDCYAWDSEEDDDDDDDAEEKD